MPLSIRRRRILRQLSRRAVTFSSPPTTAARLAVLPSLHDQRLLYGAAEDSLGADYNSYIRHDKAATAMYLLSLTVGVNAFLDIQRGILRDGCSPNRRLWPGSPPRA